MESVYGFDFEEIEKLRNNLLDMSLRNNLLNFRPRRKSIEIYDEDIASLYDLIVFKEIKMQFYPIEHLEDEEDEEDVSIDSEGTLDVEVDNTWDADAEIKASHLDKFLQTTYSEEELRKKLTSLYRENKTNLEEQGYNNFFLALGFLEWKEVDISDKVYSAPLILVPMNIEREKVSDPFTVYWNGDDIRSNLSLIYKLKDSGVDIEEFEEFDDVDDLIDYLKSIESAVQNKEGWKVSKDIYLSNFSFKKFVMFKDLDSCNWADLNDSSVSKILGLNDDDLEYVDLDDDFSFDDISSSDIYNVLDADSSQLAVLEEAKQGKNLVVEGPPGTGKSQTIVNLIAELMAMNKKILFVSEKRAALDVVKSRLDDLGLGDGCLELHGKNSNKKEILKELKETFGLDRIYLKDRSNFQDLDDIKEDLNEYINTLHTFYKDTGLTAFDLIGYYINNKDILEKNDQEILDLELGDVSSLDDEKRGEIVNIIDNLKSYYDLIKPLGENFWKDTYPKDLSSMDAKDIESDLNDIIVALDDFDDFDGKIHDLTGIDKLGDLNIEPAISKLKILKPDLKLIKPADHVEQLIDDVSIFQEKSKNLNLDIFELDLDSLDKQTADLMSNIDSLNIDLALVENEDLKSINSDFKSKKDYIESSNLERALDDSNLDNKLNDFKSKKDYIESSNLERALDNPDLENKLNIFKTKKDSLFKRTFNSEFKNIKKQFHSYYSYDVSDDVIINDLEKLIDVNKDYTVIKKEFNSYYDSDVSSNQILEDFDKIMEVNYDLSKLRNKILAYSNSDLTDDKILIESENLISWADDLDNIISNLNSYNASTNLKSIRSKVQELIELKKLMEHINDKEEIGKYYFNDSWNSFKSNVSDLNDKLETLKLFNNYYGIGFFNNKTIELIENIDIEKLESYTDKLKLDKNKILDLYRRLNHKLNFKNEFLIPDVKSDYSNIDDERFIKIDNFKSLMSSLLDNIGGLNSYRLFIKYCDENSNEYTENLIKYIKLDMINSDLFRNIFYYNFSKTALKDIFSSNDVLDDFNYYLHEKKIDKFKQLDDEVMKANRIRVKEILSINRPNLLSNVGPQSSLGILKHEFAKKRKIMPIRKLLARTFDVISSIKPCFMMSPLSIAQYLEPSTFESYFDYVIFDEASQVKIEDSMGALLRAKKYIVMGDTKQLPPTSFFEKEVDIDDSEEENYTDDVESILHLCKNTTETKMLKWHYRSRHESLINVSNNEFYDNKLYVFPSPMKDKEDLGLKFVYDPNTEYYRGAGSNNIKEAENLVEYAFDLVRKYGNSRSIGVGTFNIKQCNTILDVLEEKLREHPELEQYFNESGKDGFFVKNLENIQGDERDIILISVGYGKDLNGKLSMGFGPLNREGGERRLNVLITRARMQCVVFSNFKSSEMNTTPNTPRGVEALKTFLYYAEKGEFPENYHTGEDFDSPFEESVYNFLTDEGYIVEKQVGCAGYKIDLAIVDKEDSNRYILAIECDGAAYHSSRSARDRDRLRQNVLEGLGWKFYRIWSTDWFHETRQAKSRLLNAIEDAIINKNNKNLAKKAESNFEPETIIKSNEDTINEELENYFEDYKYCTDFLKYGRTYVDVLQALIEVEEPIHIDDIYDNLKRVTGSKATKKFKNTVNNELRFVSSVDHFGNFYYTADFNFDSMKVRKREKPNIDRISKQEIEKAVIYTLKMEFSSNRESLIKSASKHLGFKKIRDKINKIFNQIIDENLNKGVLKDNNGLIELT